MLSPKLNVLGYCSDTECGSNSSFQLWEWWDEHKEEILSQLLLQDPFFNSFKYDIAEGLIFFFFFLVYTTDGHAELVDIPALWDVLYKR